MIPGLLLLALGVCLLVLSFTCNTFSRSIAISVFDAGLSVIAIVAGVNLVF